MTAEAQPHFVLEPAIVLVRPQLGENIGACARAMRNCGLADLRLVAPRDGWPSERARAAATGAVSVIEAARRFERVEDAIADLGLVFATTARRRDMLKTAVSLEEAVAELRRSNVPAGFLFGPERTGLGNEDVLLASKLLHIELDPSFQSLNLAQAVLLVAYEVFRGRGAAPGFGSGRLQGLEELEEPQEAAEDGPGALSEERRPATSAELQNLFEHLEQELDAASFFRVEAKRVATLYSLRNALQRGGLRRHEVRLLHGVISALTGRRKDGSPVRRPSSKAK
jgi:tRNA/rRNA methyltransferase